jgi:TubC N-terminal docking domain
MSALRLIEAVQRAGGAITLLGDRLRLSAPEPLPQDLLQELRAHKAELIEHLQHARQPKLGPPATSRLTDCTEPPVEVTGTEAVIRTRTGARQTYHRRPRDPLYRAERCLVWELS